jgi:hypothetical protein
MNLTIRGAIRRFIAWMETGPAWQTAWFIPLVLALWIVASIINLFPHKETHEPDEFLQAFEDYFFGIVVITFAMMITYTVTNGSMAEWIGTFLAAQDNSFSYTERLAAFSAVLVLLIGMVVVFGIALNRVPDNDQVIDAIGDQSDELNERFVELENRFDEKLETIRKDLDDLTPGYTTPIPDDRSPNGSEPDMEILNALDPMTKLAILGGMILALVFLFVTRRK